MTFGPVSKPTPHPAPSGCSCTSLPPFKACYPAERALRPSLSPKFTRWSQWMPKNSAAISDFFRVPTRFLRSVQLERDFHDVAALEHYVVTPHMAGAFRRIADGLRANSGHRAWRITGDYGAGKSSFALVLAHLFQDMSPFAVSRIADAIGWPVRHQNMSATAGSGLLPGLRLGGDVACAFLQTENGRSRGRGPVGRAAGLGTRRRSRYWKRPSARSRPNDPAGRHALHVRPDEGRAAGPAKSRIEMDTLHRSRHRPPMRPAILEGAHAAPSGVPG